MSGAASVSSSDARCASSHQPKLGTFVINRSHLAMPTRILGVFVCLFLLLLLGPAAQATFRKPDLEKIPVEKLIKSLTAQAEKETKNINTRYNLARVHAMAYA